MGDLNVLYVSAFGNLLQIQYRAAGFQLFCKGHFQTPYLEFFGGRCSKMSTAHLAKAAFRESLAASRVSARAVQETWLFLNIYQDTPLSSWKCPAFSVRRGDPKPGQSQPFFRRGDSNMQGLQGLHAAKPPTCQILQICAGRRDPDKSIGRVPDAGFPGCSCKRHPGLSKRAISKSGFFKIVLLVRRGHPDRNIQRSPNAAFPECTLPV